MALDQRVVMERILFPVVAVGKICPLLRRGGARSALVFLPDAEIEVDFPPHDAPVLAR